MKTSFSLLLAIALGQVACAQSLADQDLNAPFGWANCTSLTSGDSYTVTGGAGSSTAKSITLKSTGSDMRNAISNAIKNNDYIIFDGSDGDFIISYSVDVSTQSNKTIVGINGARLCTQFYLTEEIRQALDDAKVKSASTSGGGGTLTNGQNVSEEREYLTRQTIINLTGDASEKCRKAGVFNLKSCNNIIVRNLKFVGPGPCDVGGYDLISSTNTTHLWVDHCEFTDGIDGNFDITKQSDFVTVSWCIFQYTDRAYDHMNTNLVGSSDSETADEDKLNVTWANNIWGYRCNQRMPMARFGTIHMINNYFNCAGNSNAINPRRNSEFLVEGNYFATGVRAYGSSDAISCNFVGNYAEDNSTTFTSFGTRATIPYKYTVANVLEVPSFLTASNGAGATLSDPLTIGRSTTAAHAGADRSVESVRYYSIGGALLPAPKGFCVKVTNYSDGTKSSEKIIK